MRLATKITLPFSLLLLLTGTLLVSLSHFFFVAELEAEAKARFELKAFHTMDTIDRMLFDRLADLQVMKGDALLSTAVLPPQTEVTARLIHYRNILKQYTSISLFTLDRIRLADSSGMGVGERDPVTGYWPEIAQGKSPVVSIYRDPTTMSILINFAIIMDDQRGKPIRVLVERMPIERLNEILDIHPSLTQGKATFGMDLVNREGTLFYSNHHPKEGLLYATAQLWEEVHTELLAKKTSGTITVRHDGRKYFLTFVDEPGHLDFTGNGWTLIQHIDTDQALAPAQALRRKMLLAFLPLLLLVLAAAYFLSRSLVRPLRQLQDAAREIGGGNLEIDVPVSSQDEIGELAAMFNTMTDKLKTARQVLSAYADTLQQEKDFTTALIDSLPGLFYLLNASNKIIRLNNTVPTVSGYTAEEIQTRSPLELIAEEDRETVAHTIQTAFAQGRASIEALLLTKSGERIPYLFTGRRFETSGMLFVVGIGLDISQIKELEARQNTLIQDLAASNKELESFAYVVSHDLKAPLRGIGSLAGWLAADYGDTLGDKGKEIIALLIQRVQRLNNLIDGILQYSRVGRSRGETREIPLTPLLTELIDLLAAPKEVEIRIETELPTIIGDRAKIFQVFQNLLSNAVKHLDKPEGLIRIGCLQRGEDTVPTFYVADNGPGIEEKYFDRIFDLFQTLKSRDEVENTGVGLTIVKKIVEMQGGRIWVESQVGAGTTFWFTLFHF